MEGINKKEVRRLYRHLLIANTNLSEREDARNSFLNSLNKIKDISSTKKADLSIRKELDILEGQIVSLINKERRVITHVYDDESYGNKLIKRINALEKKLECYMKYKNDRMERIKQLEEKISGKEPALKNKAVKKTVKKKATKKANKKK